jgi:hypothetical protein
MSLSKRVADYLAGLPGVQEVRPIRLAIGRQRYHGAWYRQARDHNGTPYQQEACYLVGGLPAAYRRSTRVAFILPNSAADWYVACYMPADRAADPKFAAYHPFGATFQLMPWTAAEPIDKYEPRPRRRIVATTWGGTGQ